MLIYLVTSNASKYQEIKKILLRYDIIVKRKNIDLPEIKSLDPKEVTIDKAKKAFKIIKQPVFVDDTGIFFSNYKKFPGAISRFVFSTLGYKGIFRLIDNNQKAYFQTYIAYLDGKLKQPKIFIGTCRGKLIRKVAGRKRKKMPYDNIFIPDGEKRTFAELGMVGKQKYDHRSKAIKKLASFLINS